MIAGMVRPNLSKCDRSIPKSETSTRGGHKSTFSKRIFGLEQMSNNLEINGLLKIGKKQSIDQMETEVPENRGF